MRDQRIAAFLTLDDGSGWGDCDSFGGCYGRGEGAGYGSGGRGDGDGSGWGYSSSGWGWGNGSGSNNGWGYGYGLYDCSGAGSSTGLGYGEGGGSGAGLYDGSGDGDGDDGDNDDDDYDYDYDDDGYYDGYGSLRYIKSFCGSRVYMIDDVPTIIDRVTGGIAKGRILRIDMTTTPCFVVKGGGYFAHGDTLRDAMDALREKQFEDMPEDERIEAFIAVHEHGKQYPCADLYDWHHKLTGSCEMGRREFAKAHGIDIEHGSMTVDEFIGLTRNAYGGNVIRALEKAWETTEAAPIWKV